MRRGHNDLSGAAFASGEQSRLKVCRKLYVFIGLKEIFPPRLSRLEALFRLVGWKKEFTHERARSRLVSDFPAVAKLLIGRVERPGG